MRYQEDACVNAFSILCINSILGRNDAYQLVKIGDQLLRGIVERPPCIVETSVQVWAREGDFE